MTTLLTRALLAVAALKLAIGLAGFFIRLAGSWTPVPGGPAPIVNVFQIAALAGAGGVLIVGGRRDGRARNLGTAYVLLASACSNRLIVRLSETLGEPEPFFGLFYSLALDALAPLYLWLFVRDFPEDPLGSHDRVTRVAIPACFGLGALLLLANLVPARPDLAPPLRALRTQDGGSLFYAIEFGAILAAFVFALVKARRARQEERRRVSLLVLAFLGGFSPAAVEFLLLATVPPFADLFRDPDVVLANQFLMQPGLLSIPFTTAYAVLVHKALDVRLILRKALQYAFAKSTVLALIALPLGSFVVVLYRHRDETLSTVFSGPRPAFLLLATAVGVSAFAGRKTLLDAIDRRFFREHVDAQRTLAQLVEKSRGAANATELGALLTSEIDRALHLDSIALLAYDPRAGVLAAPDGAVRPLDPTSALASLVSGASQPLAVDLTSGRSPFALLPEADRVWLADGGFQLLVPLLSSDGGLVGLLALGEKKSELPFSAEDRLLLETVAASGALALENRLLRSSRGSQGSGGDGSPLPASDEVARECPVCRTLFPSRSARCVPCGVDLLPALVPYVLGGKFRFEKRIGEGGMGIVYRANDLTLGRSVAIKTLPRISPESAMRLRREARAAAAVSHPNLALIFGAETWRGTPMLVFEYLDGGTLADRLDRQRLTPAEAVALGITLASALETAHASGVLHRDIKPSNIGYGRDGTPKLLDFGLARILDDTRRETPTRTGSGPNRTQPLLDLSGTRSDIVVGTPAYLSPEAVVGDSPDPSFDLWGLAIVLYESLTGSNPVAGGPLLDMMKRIRAGKVPDPAREIPFCPPSLAAFLRNALARERYRRPSSAAEFRKGLMRVESALAA